METRSEDTARPRVSAGSLRSVQLLYGLVAVLAIGAGLLLLAMPGTTRRFFAWGLKPPPWPR